MEPLGLLPSEQPRCPPDTAGKCDVPVHITDWMPTFCRLAGYEPTEDLKWDGSDVWPILTGELARRSHPLYWAGTRNDMAVRDGDWKLIARPSDSGSNVELFNLADDPSERNNLAERLPERVERLQRLIARLARADGDSAVNE